MEAFSCNESSKKYQHRLDELAWILQGSSMCTAVTIIDKKIHISANEFFIGKE
jgi:hypothetical protein